MNNRIKKKQVKMKEKNKGLFTVGDTDIMSFQSRSDGNHNIIKYYGKNKQLIYEIDKNLSTQEVKYYDENHNEITDTDVLEDIKNVGKQTVDMSDSDIEEVEEPNISSIDIDDVLNNLLDEDEEEVVKDEIVIGEPVEKSSIFKRMLDKILPSGFIDKPDEVEEVEFSEPEEVVLDENEEQNIEEQDDTKTSFVSKATDKILDFFKLPEETEEDKVSIKDKIVKKYKEIRRKGFEVPKTIEKPILNTDGDVIWRKVVYKDLGITEIYDEENNLLSLNYNNAITVEYGENNSDVTFLGSKTLPFIHLTKDGYDFIDALSAYKFLLGNDCRVEINKDGTAIYYKGDESVSLPSNPTVPLEGTKIFEGLYVIKDQENNCETFTYNGKFIAKRHFANENEVEYYDENDQLDMVIKYDKNAKLGFVYNNQGILQAVEFLGIDVLIKNINTDDERINYAYSTKQYEFYRKDNEYFVENDHKLYSVCEKEDGIVETSIYGVFSNKKNHMTYYPNGIGIEVGCFGRTISVNNVKVFTEYSLPNGNFVIKDEDGNIVKSNVQSIDNELEFYTNLLNELGIDMENNQVSQRDKNKDGKKKAKKAAKIDYGIMKAYKLSKKFVKDSKESLSGKDFNKYAKKIKNISKKVKVKLEDITSSKDVYQSAVSGAINNITRNYEELLEVDEFGFVTAESYQRYLEEKGRDAALEKADNIYNQADFINNTINNLKEQEEETYKKIKKNYFKVIKTRIVLGLTAISLGLGGVKASSLIVPKSNNNQESSIDNSNEMDEQIQIEYEVDQDKIDDQARAYVEPTMIPVPTATPAPTATPIPTSTPTPIPTPISEPVTLQNSAVEVIDGYVFTEGAQEQTSKETLNGQKEYLEKLKAEVVDSKVEENETVDEIYSIGTTVGVNPGALVYSDIYSMSNAINGQHSYYQDSIAREIESIVMSNGEDIINVKDMKDVEKLTQQGYSVTGYSLINEYSKSTTDIEGRYAHDDVYVLKLKK